MDSEEAQALLSEVKTAPPPISEYLPGMKRPSTKHITEVPLKSSKKCSPKLPLPALKEITEVDKKMSKCHSATITQTPALPTANSFNTRLPLDDLTNRQELVLLLLAL